MGKPTGFKEVSREMPRRRPVELRVLDWDEIYLDFPEDKLKKQGSRCMDCGVPFCNNGCPLGNLIPDWNDLVYRGRWREALDALLKTNNFPEWTGRICPAPCEEACVLSINDKPVTIKLIEQSIVDRGFAEGWITPQPPATRTGKKVAVIGSGPAGLAAAAQLNKAGHRVSVYERADRPGGLLLYGIPDFKMNKLTGHPADQTDGGRGHHLRLQRRSRHDGERRISCAASLTRSCLPPVRPRHATSTSPGAN